MSLETSSLLLHLSKPTFLKLLRRPKIFRSLVYSKLTTLFINSLLESNYAVSVLFEWLVVVVQKE